jgi:hypothetical protein
MMEDEPPPPPSQTVINYPTPQSAGEAAKESGAASLQTFKDALSSGVYGDYAQQLTDIQRKQAPQLSQIQLDQTKVFGPQIISATTDLLKQADPTRFELQKTLTQQTLDDLKLKGQLSPEEQRQVQQDMRAAYEAKGIRTSVPAAIGEVSQLNMASFQKDQQRKQNAAAVLAGQQPNSIFSAAGMGNALAPSQTQNVGGLAGQFSPNANAIMGYQQNMFNQMSQNAMGQANLANNQWQFNVQNSSNPFLTGLGVASGVAGTVGSIMSGGCWVAEELYGKDHEKTLTVRRYVHKHKNDNSKLGEFMRAYIERGLEWAQEIKSDLNLRELARKAWDELFVIARKELKP